MRDVSSRGQADSGGVDVLTRRMTHESRTQQTSNERVQSLRSTRSWLGASAHVPGHAMVP